MHRRTGARKRQTPDRCRRRIACTVHATEDVRAIEIPEKGRGFAPGDASAVGEAKRSVRGRLRGT